ncbi:MAG TPA: class I SAM-dependent methyltransferase [Anaerolineales bacterium]|nr:class I SAM-dependent methyltransferase [Anaerolineales bacterium]
MKQNVRQFYDQIGWSQVEEGIYQNARYEDLRPVSQEYIRRCHLRVNRHLAKTGKYLLDAGSGPIQYPEYLTYSEGYRYRVCADMSITALKEARKKIGEHGMFVGADIANLPFKRDIFDGVVTLHTIHHLPLSEHARAYDSLHRVLSPGRSAVVVNGWSTSPIMDPFRSLSKLRKRVWMWKNRQISKSQISKEQSAISNLQSPISNPDDDPKNTFVEKHSPRWFKRTIAPRMETQILVWRSASVHFLKNYIFENRGGRGLLRLLFWLEERFPRFFGEKGTYPLIVIRKQVDK